MSLKVKKNQKELVNDRTYKAGEIIPPLNENEEQRLLNLGVCELSADLPLPHAVEGDHGQDDGDKRAGGPSGEDQLPLDEKTNPVLTVEQFAELKADEQKAHLKALGIDPAGKEDERIVQYEDWYAEQLPEGELNVHL